MVDLIPWRSKNRSRAGGSERGQRSRATLRDDVEGMFDRFWRDPWGTSLSALASRAGVLPRLDLSESDNEITVRAELPGVKPEDIHVEVTGNVLRLSGEKTEEHSEQSGDTRWSECQYGSFSRMVQLPTAVDADKVDAAFKDGVLTITLPKHPEARPKRVEVHGAKA